MKDQLKRLLEPAETSRADTFRWSDKRPVRQQVISGIRRASGLIAGFGILVVSAGGIAVISDQQSTHTVGAVVAAWLGLIVAAIVMIWTANRWAPFVTGFFALAICRIAAVLMVGSGSNHASRTIPWAEVATFLLYAIAVVALTLRFVVDRPARTTILDRFALTFFALASLRQLALPRQLPPWSLLAGVLALLIAWCARFRPRRSNDRLHNRSSKRHG